MPAFLLNILVFLAGSIYYVVPTVIFILAVAAYFQRHKISLKRWSKILLIATAIYYPVYAIIESVAQYWVWAGNSLSKTLVQSPLPPVMKGVSLWYDIPFMRTSHWGYFIYYSWGRFWMPVVLAFVATFFFWVLLRALKRYQERFFEDGEVELGTLCAFLPGWPGFVIFVPLVFIAVVIVSIFRMIFLKESYTTLGAPLLFAVLLYFVLGTYFLNLTGLWVLKA